MFDTQGQVGLTDCQVLESKDLDTKTKEAFEKGPHKLLLDEYDTRVEETKFFKSVQASVQQNIKVRAKWVDDPSNGETGTIGWIVESVSLGNGPMENPDTYTEFEF